MDKTNFLAIYAEAHNKTLTPENIKATFHKTGVIPSDPDVVTAEMMAPSLATSTRGAVPVQQCTTVKVMSKMVVDYIDHQKITSTAGNSPNRIQNTTGLPTAPFFMSSAIDGLASTSASFLASTSPIKSTLAPPTFEPSPVSPTRPSRYCGLLGKSM